MMKSPRRPAALSLILIVLVTSTLFSASFSSCCMGGNGCMFSDSNSQDPFIGEGSTLSGSGEFVAAQRVFRNNCISCHGAFAAYTESQWVSLGYVSPSNPDESTIFLRLSNNGVGGPQNMPPGVTMSSTDVAAIRTWITQMSADVGGGGGTTGAAARTSAALSVLRSANNGCVTCHNGLAPYTNVTGASAAYSGQTVTPFSAFTTDNEFVTTGLVTPGIEATNSWLFRALRGHGNIGTMPKSPATTMSAADAATLEEWIEKMGEP